MQLFPNSILHIQNRFPCPASFRGISGRNGTGKPLLSRKSPVPRLRIWNARDLRCWTVLIHGISLRLFRVYVETLFMGNSEKQLGSNSLWGVGFAMGVILLWCITNVERRWIGTKKQYRESEVGSVRWTRNKCLVNIKSFECQYLVRV